ncbi:MAG: DEAD/DEAH box helicase [Bacteroidota bacterium]
MSDFLSLGLSQPLLDALAEIGFVQPTPIQEEAIPFLLSGERDLVGLAQTGTGKTAAFGLPLIDRIDTEVGYPQALVLAPTRELCVQISKEMQSFAAFIPQLNITPVYGGADIRRQISSIKRGSQLIVATPGRLRDLINRKAISLEQIATVVLDEADEMLNMGFKEEIDAILESVPEERRTWLFSATMPPDVRRLCKHYMHDPHEIKVGNTNQTNQDIEHQLIFVRPRGRMEVLRRFIDADPELYGLVFCRTRAETQTLTEDLQREGYHADVLNGDLSQAQRDRAMRRFREKRVTILVATDVAARGLDVQGITHVFHLNIPDEMAFYTHRSGRTGRAGQKGLSILLAHPNDHYKVRRLDRHLKLNFTEVEPPSVLKLLEKRLQSRFEQLAKSEAISPLNPLVEELSIALEGLTKEELVARIAARTFLQLPSVYQREALSELMPGRQKSNPKKKTHGTQPAYGKTERSSSKGLQYQRIFLNVGRKEVSQVADFVEFVSHYGEIDPKAIGDVELQEKHTFFDVEQKIAGALVKRFKNAEWDGRELRMNYDDGPKRSSGGGDRGFRKKKKNSNRGAYGKKRKKGAAYGFKKKRRS